MRKAAFYSALATRPRQQHLTLFQAISLLKLLRVLRKHCYCCLDGVKTGLDSTWVDGNDTNSLANVGEKVSHICTIKNEGTTSLESFCVTVDSLGETCQDCPEAGTLVPEAIFTCTIETVVSTSNRAKPVLLHLLDNDGLRFPDSG